MAESATFVFPCLNEERTLAICIEKVKTSAASAGLTFEIIVADNGSTDKSVTIAESMGARVVPVPQKGYGAALRGGIRAASHEYVMFADSDDTYLYQDAAGVYQAAINNGAGMAIASRLTGRIENGAMPVLHRWLGTPVLTWLINHLFSGRLSDCNSGFRCIKRSEYETWNIRSNGMEFASELLIKALKAKARIVEIPSGLRCGPPLRQAHLRTWRDGMRHLLFILSEKPALFEWAGLAMLVPATVLQLVIAFTGPISLMGLNVFDLHSQALLLLTAVFGTQFYVFACSLFISSKDRPLRLTKALIEMDEGNLFFGLLTVLGAGVCTVFLMFRSWMASGFGGLDETNTLLVVVHLIAVMAMAAIGLLSVHTLKKLHMSGQT